MAKLKDKKVLVTGANGFIGRHLVKRLKSEKAEIFSIDREKSDIKGVKHFSADITDHEKIKKIVEEIKPDYIFHLAANTSRDDSEEIILMEVNFHGTENLLNALSNVNYELLVFMSTGMVYTDKNFPKFSEDSKVSPYSAYGRSKVEAEKACLSQMKKGKHVVIVRPFSVYGPGQERSDMLIPAMINAMKTGGEITMHGGDQTRDYVYVEDLVDFLMTIVEKDVKDEILNCGTGQETSIKDIVDMITEMSKEKKANVNYHPYRKKDVYRQWADMTKAKKLLGWEAKTSLRDGLKKTLG